jgi:hypothetical protein
MTVGAILRCTVTVGAMLRCVVTVGGVFSSLYRFLSFDSASFLPAIVGDGCLGCFAPVGARNDGVGWGSQ